MEIKLSEAATTEIELVEMLNGTDIPVPVMEKIYSTIRKFGNLRYHEGYDAGVGDGYTDGFGDAGREPRSR